MSLIADKTVDLLRSKICFSASVLVVATTLSAADDPEALKAFVRSHLVSHG